MIWLAFIAGVTFGWVTVVAAVLLVAQVYGGATEPIEGGLS